MNKQEFLAQLRKGLSGLPQNDIEERLTFYSEMIDDHIEEGLSEEEAILTIGSVDEIISQVVAETPLVKIAKERIKSKRQLSVGEFVLLVLGAPLWISLGVAAISVVLSLYISLWTLIVFLWSVFGSLAACSIGGALACVAFVLGGNNASGIAILSAGIACAGLAIFMFYGCKAATNGILILTKKIVTWIKNCFIEKEVA